MGHSRYRENAKNDSGAIGLIRPSSSDSGKEGSNNADWAKTYTTLMCQTNETRESINDLDILFIEAVMRNLGEQVNLKMGMPFSGLLGSISSNSSEKSSAEDVDSFFYDF